MKKLIKFLEYEGYKFSITIQLNYKVEKRIGGKRLHLVIVNDMGSNNYPQNYEVNHATMLEDIEGIIKATKAYVDRKDQDYETIAALTTIGFEKI